MTKGEVPTTAGQEQAAETAAEQVAQEQSAPVAEEKGAEKPQARQMTAEAAAAAAAAEEAAVAEAPVQMASFEAPAPAPVKAVEIDEDEKKGEKKGEQQDAQAEADAAPADLAMLPEVEMLDAIAAAEGARAMPGAEGEAGASLLSDDGGFLIPLLAVAAVGLGIAVAVGGGDDDDLPPAPPPPPPANQAPVISSGATATIAENSATTTVVYNAEATDADGDDITYTISGADAAMFTIDADDGEVRFVTSPNFEGDASYTFTVTATDEDGATDTQEVTVTVTDVDEGPSFTSGAEFDVDENVGTDTVVFTAAATDPDGGDVTYSLEGEDADMFEIDEETGEVRFIASPDFESQDSYTVTVVATDDEGDTTEQEVTVTVNDVEAEGPVFTSEAEATVEENVDVATVVLTAEAMDPDGGEVTFMLEGEDADMFTIDEETGELRFIASPDFETQDEYNVTIVATDDEGETTEQEVTISVTDVAVEGPTEVDLEDADAVAAGGDGNPATENEVDASGDDFLFVDDDDAASSTRIVNMEEGDLIRFDGDADVSFGVSADDANDLQIIVNNGGVLSEIILDDVLGDDVGFVFDEATAEEAVGFDFFQMDMVDPAPAADATFA